MISVIIPAYNAEKTIERAIMSAIKQIPDGEILVVENGCTDNTEKIVSTIKLQHEQVYLLHSMKGVSAARNEGISKAKGDWLMFLDADDYYENGTKDVLSRYISGPWDLILFGHKSGDEKRPVVNRSSDDYYSAEHIEKARSKMLENPTCYMQVWAKLFRTSIIKDNHLLFNEHLSLAEDSDFTLRYSRFCHDICFSSSIIYHYSLDSNSTMRTIDGMKIQKYVLAMEETNKVIQDESPEIIHAFQKYVLMHMNIAMVREVFVTGNSLSKANKIAQLKETSQKTIFSDAIRNTGLRECFSSRMLPFLFIKFRCYRLSAIVYGLRAKQNASKENAERERIS